MQKRTIHTITPSWIIKDKKDFDAGLRKLEELGFAVRNAKFRTQVPGPLQKARELHAAFADPRSSIVMAQRGGFSSMKVLPHLDYDLLRRHPKTLIGYSDVSTLLNVIHERTKLVTLHGPMLVNFADPKPFTIERFLNAVDGFPERDLFAGCEVRVYRHGRATGILKGGNCITLTTLTGTPWETKTDGAIVFIEDVDEKLHAVDRVLTQWVLAGKFDKVKGIIIGTFNGLDPDDVFAILAKQLKLRVPVVHCPNIGHVDNKITLPVGARVELNTRKGELVLS